MTIECYYSDCRFHGALSGEEGPFCFGNSCKASSRELKWFGELRTLRQQVANQAIIIGEMEETCVNHAQIETALSADIAAMQKQLKELVGGTKRDLLEKLEQQRRKSTRLERELVALKAGLEKRND